MVNINGVKLKIYDLDSIYNIIERRESCDDENYFPISRSYF